MLCIKFGQEKFLGNVLFASFIDIVLSKLPGTFLSSLLELLSYIIGKWYPGKSTDLMKALPWPASS